MVGGLPVGEAVVDALGGPVGPGVADAAEFVEPGTDEVLLAVGVVFDKDLLTG